MKNQSVRAIIFDHDGVLINSESIQERIWTQLFLENNIAISAEDYNTIVRGRGTPAVLRHYFGATHSEEELDKLLATKSDRTWAEYDNGIPLVPGIETFLEKLRPAQLKLAVASSAEKRKVYFTLTRLNILDRLDVVQTAENVTHSKPHPQIYLDTAEKLNVNPSECLVFEDALAGLQAAKSAGMKTVLVATSLRPNEVPKNLFDWSINDFDQEMPQSLVRAFQ